MLRRLFMLSLVAVALLCLTADNLQAQANITKIEEDWEIHLLGPDEADGTPQIANIISPWVDLWGTNFILELNHCNYPEFNAGGLQLQRWVGENFNAYTTVTKARLYKSDEVIHYTITMWLTGDRRIHCKVAGTCTNATGTATSWGTFGQDGTFKLTGSTIASDLNSYSRESSLSNASVVTAAHRVSKFCNCEVRYYSGNTLIRTDSDERPVHEYQELVTEEEE